MRTNIDNRTALILGGVGFAVLLAALWFLVVSPKRSDAARLQGEVTAAQAELAERKAALASPSAAVTVRASDVFRLAKALPESSNVAGVILDLDRLARTHDLTLEGLVPTAVVPLNGYYAQPLAVTVEGRFGDVSKFLSDTRRLVSVKKGRLRVDGRLYSATEVRIAEPDGDKTFPLIRAEILLNAFGYQPGVPAAPTTPTTPTDQSTPSSDGTTAAGVTP